MQKLKKKVKGLIKKNYYVYKIIKKVYNKFINWKYKIINNKTIRKQNEHYHKQVINALDVIKQFKDREYIVFYNPTWLGVANSSKGLFTNIVPLEHVYKQKDKDEIVKAIKECNIKNVIFSQICDGWVDIIKQLKQCNPETKIKVIWHGNCYEFFSDFTWNLNKKVIKLYNEGKIDSFAFVRSTMYEFYKKCGFKSFYLQNNVHLENIKKTRKEKSDKTVIGIYNADSRELKNIYTALSAIKLVHNSIADVVPINEGAKKFTEVLNLETKSIDEYIPTEELLKRIQQNDINIYPTFTENAPMFPLESFEVGVPCLLGNNNDYFVGTELGKYVILTREDDSKHIKEKIQRCLENRDEIMKLYKDWKNDFDLKCKKLVDDFLKN